MENLNPHSNEIDSVYLNIQIPLSIDSHDNGRYCVIETQKCFFICLVQKFITSYVIHNADINKTIVTTNVLIMAFS